MRLVQILSIVAVGALFAVGCGDKDTETDTDTDSDTDVDTDSDTDTDTDTDADIWALLGYLGEATVEPDVSYEGWERFIVQDTETEAWICQWQWTATGAVDTSCADCDWAFQVSMTEGAYVGDGTCDGMGFEAATGPWGYGFTEKYTYGQYSYNNAMMYYTAAGGYWFYVSPAIFSDGVFNYDWTYEYYY